jgi:hypothetical protein
VGSLTATDSTNLAFVTALALLVILSGTKATDPLACLEQPEGRVTVRIDSSGCFVSATEMLKLSWTTSGGELNGTWFLERELSSIQRQLDLKQVRQALSELRATQEKVETRQSGRFCMSTSRVTTRLTLTCSINEQEETRKLWLDGREACAG